mmetsp:Transcript_16526/g.46126  ORF Transcript_16526/g.46126 Transcript_16526/m.46126 type:complete len:128 (+) Transcript_16526:469-852(+)
MQLEKKLLLRTGSPTAREPLHAQAAQADVQNLLASREQQMRALMVEQQSLQKQLSIAWKMLDEKDTEVQRLQMNRQQHMEENARLRATLKEWSQRNVRLEKQLHKLSSEFEESSQRAEQQQQQQQPQ